MKLCQPIRFGVINEGLYRGAYPTLRNFRSMSRLRLSTIISLTPEPPSQDMTAFSEVAGIRLIHIPVHRNAPLTQALIANLVIAINVCLDISNNPAVFIHCLDGRRITSLFVLLVRKIQGWPPFSSFIEYWRYQTAMRTALAVTDIEKTTRDIEKFICECTNFEIPTVIPTWLWEGDRNRCMLELVGVCKTEESDRKVPQAEAKTPSVVRVTEESPLLPGMTGDPSVTLAALALHGLDMPTKKLQFD